MPTMSLPTFSVNSNFKIEAISDPFDDLRKRIGSKYGIQNQFARTLKCLEASIDAVVITLPRRLTFSVVKDCLKHKKWVLRKSLMSKFKSCRRNIRFIYRE